jgi:hypothetical protein
MVQGIRDWKAVSCHMNGRSVRQCRERFKYYLEPGLNRPQWTPSEDNLLLEKYDAIGPKWAQLALFFQGRTDIDVKNRYHRIKRSIAAMAETLEPRRRSRPVISEARKTFPPIALKDDFLPPIPSAPVDIGLPAHPRKIVVAALQKGESIANAQ